VIDGRYSLFARGSTIQKLGSAEISYIRVPFEDFDKGPINDKVIRNIGGREDGVLARGRPD
jgi:hypothetical protein